MAEFVTGISVNIMASIERMRSDFSELALVSVADAKRWVALQGLNEVRFLTIGAYVERNTIES